MCGSGQVHGSPSWQSGSARWGHPQKMEVMQSSHLQGAGCLDMGTDASLDVELFPGGVGQAMPNFQH